MLVNGSAEKEEVERKYVRARVRKRERNGQMDTRGRLPLKAVK